MKIKEKMYSIAGIITAGIMMSPLASLAAPSNIAKKASEGISKEAKNTVWWVAGIALVILGLMFAFGGERAKEASKAHSGRLIGGIVIVIFAIPIIMWIKGILN